MIAEDTWVDRLLRKAKAPPLCGCEKCPTIGDRIEAELSRPVMVMLLAIFFAVILAILAVAYVPDWRG